MVPSGIYAVEGSIGLGIWAKKSGVWQKIATDVVTIYAQYANGGQKTVTWTFDNTYNLGSGVQMFGVTVDSYTGVSAAVTQFIMAQWQAVTTSGVRSATPNGQKSTVTVRPQ